MKRHELVRHILGFDPTRCACNYSAYVYAPANFALIKYWGKENEELMVPNTNSFSVSMGKNLGTETKIQLSKNDEFVLNGKNIKKNDKKYTRLFDFLNLFRDQEVKLKIISNNTMSTGAGLASSASGFASLTMALDKFCNWNLSKKKLSMLARLGSISASRSVYENGFVEMKKEGVNTYSAPFEHKWENLCIGILKFSNKEKSISSTEGMRKTVEESLLYKYGWKKQVETDLKEIKITIKKKDFEKFSEIVQRNALSMHATAISAGILYWSEDTLKTIKYILNLQKEKVPICFTEDAGEHLKIFAEDKKVLKRYFDEIEVWELF